MTGRGLLGGAAALAPVALAVMLPELCACDGPCGDTSSDEDNCGSCGHQCGPAGFCDEGECRCSGSVGICDGLCVDLDSSPLHCGDCETQCGGAFPFCSDGACVRCGYSPRGKPLDECGDICADTEFDSSNCGGCGNACPAESLCQLGSCVEPTGECTSDCDPSRRELCCDTPAGPECVRIDSSAEHCGACGVRCGNCQGGECIPF